nr:NADH dehydrogenase subunit 2 [Laelaps sp. 1 JO-2023a]
MSISWMKKLSYLMMVMSFFVVVMSESYFLMWFSFELNLVSFCYIMWNGKNFSSINSMMKYYIIQSLSSMLFLMMLILSESMMVYNLSVSFLSVMMIFKMGLFPFIFWVPEVVEGMDWNSLIIFFTGQKIIPLYILTILDFYYMYMVIILTMMMGLLLMYNQISIRKFMAYSSMVHSGWMLMSIDMGVLVWVLYLLIYFISMYNMMKLESLNSFYQLKFLFFSDMMLILLIFLNLSGLPPFLGFFSKIYIMFFLMDSSFSIMIFMIFVSILTSYVYLMYMSMMFFFKKKNINMKMEKFKFSMNMLFLMVMLFIFLMFL